VRRGLRDPAGLKGGNNSRRTRRFGREPRRRGLKRCGRVAWSEDKPPIFIPVERGGGEDYASPSDASDDTVKRIVGRRVSKGSTIHTDGFPSYSCLGGAGYKHESVNHSAGEYARGKAHANRCENRASPVRAWPACHRGEV